MNARQLGHIIAEARVRAGLTQAQLAQEADVAYSTIAKIERGAIKHPSFFTMQKLAPVLGISLDDLIGKVAHPEPKAFLRSPEKLDIAIRMVFCDVNGVLVRFFQRGFTSLSEEIGVELGRIEEIFWHLNDAGCRSDITVAQFNKQLAEALGVGKVDWRQHYMKAVEPIKTMHKCLKEVAQLYEVGLLTNIFPGFVKAMQEEGLIPDLPYAAIVDSSEVHTIKPERAIFEIAEKMSRHKGQEILLIDDTRANLVAAEKLHWRVMWFDDFDVIGSETRIRKVLGLKPPKHS